MEKRNQGILSPSCFKLEVLIERFHKKYIKNENGCWIWISAKNNWYGNFCMIGKQEKSHRASYRLFKGEIPVNMVVSHSCDVPSCVNPDHLTASTQKENIHEQIKRNRNTRGSLSHHAKITPREVVAIRALWCTGKLTQGEMAKAYGLRQQSISKIVTNKKWRDLI